MAFRRRIYLLRQPAIISQASRFVRFLPPHLYAGWQEQPCRLRHLLHEADTISTMIISQRIVDFLI